jgi:hypothetical protein
MSLEATMPLIPGGKRSIQTSPSPPMKEAREMKHLITEKQGESQ